jgi:hypothetical protein
MGTELPTKVMLGQTLVLMQMTFLDKVRKVGRLAISKILTPINPLKSKLVQVIFKNSVRTAKKTPHFTITKINRLTLFKEIIGVCSENHTKHTNTKRIFTDC